ncbi:MAG: hypothetical protein ACE5E4_01730 [Candidatus Binatia bacterium]
MSNFDTAEKLGEMDLETSRCREHQGDLYVQGGDPQLDGEEKALEWTPERSLMLAILEDAIACYRRTLKRPRQNPEILARQSEYWIRLDDWNAPFSFNNVCDSLGLDPEGTRRRILDGKASELFRVAAI